MCFAANNILTMRSCKYALWWKMTDRFFRAVKEWFKYENKFGYGMITQLLNSVIAKYRYLSMSRRSIIFWWLESTARRCQSTIFCATSSNNAIIVAIVIICVTFLAPQSIKVTRILNIDWYDEQQFRNRILMCYQFFWTELNTKITKQTRCLARAFHPYLWCIYNNLERSILFQTNISS